MILLKISEEKKNKKYQFNILWNNGALNDKLNVGITRTDGRLCQIIYFGLAFARRSVV